MEGLVVIENSEYTKVPLKHVSVCLGELDLAVRAILAFWSPLDESIAVTRLEAVIDGRKIAASIMEKICTTMH